MGGEELADVTGQQVLNRETDEEASKEIERLGNGTLDQESDELLDMSAVIDID